MPGGVYTSLVDKVWSCASVQYSLDRYWDGTIPSDGSRKLVVPLRKKTHRIKATFVVRHVFSGYIRNRVAPMIPGLEEAL